MDLVLIQVFLNTTVIPSISLLLYLANFEKWSLDGGDGFAFYSRTRQSERV